MKKLYYSIGEVSDMLGEEQHTLRHWEKTFTVLKPKKNSRGTRAYIEQDIQTLIAIKHLLREELMSVKDVKERLSKGKKAVDEIISSIDYRNPSPDSTQPDEKKNITEEIVSEKDSQYKAPKSQPSKDVAVPTLSDNTSQLLKNELKELKSVLLDTKEQLESIKWG